MMTSQRWITQTGGTRGLPTHGGRRSGAGPGPSDGPLCARGATRARQRGLSIVEMMVGIAIGLIIVAASTLMVAGQLADNRRLMLETQIQQDLRAAADLMARDLRRAGFWRDAHLNTGAAAAAGNAITNPYAAMSVPSTAAPQDPIRFAYADRSAAENQTIDDSERRGFRLSNGVLQAELGNGNWQPVTDPAVLRIDDLSVQARLECVALRCDAGNATCQSFVRAGTTPLSCSAGDAPCPAYQQVRYLTITITGSAAYDTSLVRSIRTGVRLRNDAVSNTCAERL